MINRCLNESKLKKKDYNKIKSYILRRCIRLVGVSKGDLAKLMLYIIITHMLYIITQCMLYIIIRQNSSFFMVQLLHATFPFIAHYKLKRNFLP